LAIAPKRRNGRAVAQRRRKNWHTHFCFNADLGVDN
jgi:hypothetical protein